MEDCATADEHALADLHMAGEQGVVGEDGVVAEVDIVREMRAGHEEASVADDGGAALRGAAVDGAVFADFIPIADADFAARLGLEREVLRIAADDGAIADEVARAHPHMRADDGVGLDEASLADAGRAFHHGIGPDLDAAAELRRGVDDGGGMDHGGSMMPASRKLNHGCRPSSPEPMMTWSRNVIWSRCAASTRRRVVRRSATLGEGSPEG